MNDSELNLKIAKRNKHDSNIYFILLFFIINIFLAIADFKNFFTWLTPISTLSLPEFNSLELMTFHITTSGIVSGAMSFIYSKVDERVLDISMKNWIIKQTIYRVSILSLFIILFVTDFLAVLGFVLNIQKYMILNLLSFMCIVMMIIYRIYTYSSKKSKFYEKIIQKLGKGGTQSELLAYEILMKWKNNYTEIKKTNSIPQNKKHNSYIEEELLVHYAIYLNLNVDKNKNHKMIKAHARKLISEDNRIENDIFNYLQCSKKFSDLKNINHDEFLTWITDNILSDN